MEAIQQLQTVAAASQTAAQHSGMRVAALAQQQRQHILNQQYEALQRQRRSSQAAASLDPDDERARVAGADLFDHDDYSNPSDDNYSVGAYDGDGDAGSAAVAGPRGHSIPVPLPAPSGFGTIVASRRISFGGYSLLFFALAEDEIVGKVILDDGKPHDPKLLQSVLQHIPPGSTVVDAGANLGGYATFFAAAAGPTGRVVAFEPQRLMFGLLCANAMANNLLNVHANKVALGFREGKAHMSSWIPDGVSGGTRYDEAVKEGATINFGGMSLGEGGEEVDMRTLDSYNLSNVSVIKVDVQGAERLLFYGAQDTIRRNMPVVFYEDTESTFTVTQEMIEDMAIPPGVVAFDVAGFLTGLGYRRLRTNNTNDATYVPPGNAWYNAEADIPLLNTPSRSEPQAVGLEPGRLLGRKWQQGVTGTVGNGSNGQEQPRPQQHPAPLLRRPTPTLPDSDAHADNLPAAAVRAAVGNGRVVHSWRHE